MANSTDSTDTLLLPLREKPAIVRIGLSVHGLRRAETFVMDRAWGLHLYWWEGTVEFGGRRYALAPNCTSVTPPDISLTWRFPRRRCEHFFAHFRLPESDLPLVPVPVVRNLGAEAARFADKFGKAVAFFNTEPVRAEVLLWQMLWELSDPLTPEATPALDYRPTSVSTAATIVDNELRFSPSVAQIARRVGMSVNHLNRLFRAHHKMTVGQYIRMRRMEKARHLLAHSNVPIQVVAEDVGLADVQAFNKFCRKFLGMSPREYRRQA